MDINDYEKCFNTTHTGTPCSPKCVLFLSPEEVKEIVKKEAEK